MPPAQGRQGNMKLSPSGPQCGHLLLAGEASPQSRDRACTSCSLWGLSLGGGVTTTVTWTPPVVPPLWASVSQVYPWALHTEALWRSSRDWRRQGRPHPTSRPLGKPSCAHGGHLPSTWTLSHSQRDLPPSTGGCETTVLGKGRYYFPVTAMTSPYTPGSLNNPNVQPPGLELRSPMQGSPVWLEGIFLELLSGGSGERFISWLTRVAGRFQFFSVIGLRSPFPVWFSTEGHPQLLGAFTFLSSRTLPHLQSPGQQVKSLAPLAALLLAPACRCVHEALPDG